MASIPGRTVVPCTTCRQSLIASPGETEIFCSACKSVTLTSVKCLGCGVSLACSAKSPAISCSVCSTVTMIQDRVAKCIATPKQCTHCYAQLLVPSTQSSVKCPKCQNTISANAPSSTRPPPTTTSSSQLGTNRSAASAPSAAGGGGGGGMMAASATQMGNGAPALPAPEVAVDLEHLILDPPENTSFGFTTAKYSITEAPEMEPGAPPLCNFTDGGLPVTFVTDYGVAQKAGMRAGDVIVRVNGIDVTAVRATDVVETVRTAARPVRVDVLRRNTQAQLRQAKAGGAGGGGQTNVKSGFFSRLGEGFKTLTRPADTQRTGNSQSNAQQSGGGGSGGGGQRTFSLGGGEGGARRQLSAAEEEKMVSEFTSVTGIDLVLAYEVLEKNNWNLSRAIEQQLGSPTSQQQPSQPSAQQQQQQRALLLEQQQQQQRMQQLHQEKLQLQQRLLQAQQQAQQQAAATRAAASSAPPPPVMGAAPGTQSAQSVLVDQVTSVLGLDRVAATALLRECGWSVETAIDKGLEAAAAASPHQSAYPPISELDRLAPPPSLPSWIADPSRAAVPLARPSYADPSQYHQQQPPQQQAQPYPASAYPQADQPAPPPSFTYTGSAGPAGQAGYPFVAQAAPWSSSLHAAAAPAAPPLASSSQPSAAPPAVAPIAASWQQPQVPSTNPSWSAPPAAPPAQAEQQQHQQQQQQQPAASAPSAAPATDGSWTDVATWLDSIGMRQYEYIFREQELLDPTSICELTEDDLKELGITLIGAKKKLMAAINRLRAAHGMDPAN